MGRKYRGTLIRGRDHYRLLGIAQKGYTAWNPLNVRNVLNQNCCIFGNGKSLFYIKKNY